MVICFVLYNCRVFTYFRSSCFFIIIARRNDNIFIPKKSPGIKAFTRNLVFIIGYKYEFFYRMYAGRGCGRKCFYVITGAIRYLCGNNSFCIDCRKIIYAIFSDKNPKKFGQLRVIHAGIKYL